MTTTGISGTIAKMLSYVTLNALIGKPDVAKEVQATKISAQYRSKTKDIKIVAKTKNMGKLELIVKKNSTGDYTVQQANYYDHNKIAFPIIP